MITPSESRPAPGYRERLDHFKDTDAEKNDMINELIENLENAKLDLESERTGRRRLQDRVSELENMTRLQDGRTFVLVLIDADADDYIFRDKFLNQSAAGGRDAADELNIRVKEYLSSLALDSTKTEIIVRAYADLKALHGACIKNGKMKSGSNLLHFAHGFNQRQGLFDFVDVGPGKEGADNKIRGMFNIRCKHIIFGACHDSGYAQYLGKFAADPSLCDRITLLHGSNPRASFDRLGLRRTLKLDTVFAPNKMSNNDITRPLVPPMPWPSFPNVVTPSASVSAPGKHVYVNPAPLAERLGPVILDEEGKRVDKALNVDITSRYLNVLRQQKLCVYYYLRGRCEGCACDKNHIASPLNAKEFDCLWYLSRHGLCFKNRKGKVCADERCVYGHEEGFQIGSGQVQA